MQLEHLLWENRNYYSLFKSTIIELTNDINPAVKLASIFTLLPVINIEREWALNRILELYKEDYRFAGHNNLKNIFFLSYNQNREVVLDTILKCFNSEDKDLIRVGSYALAEMNLLYGEFDHIITDINKFNQNQATATIEMITLYFNKDQYNERCKQILNAFRDADYDLEVSFSKLFYDGLIRLDRDYEFLNKIMKSKVSRRLLHSFVRYLEKESKSLTDYSEIIVTLSNYLIDNLTTTELKPWGLEEELSKLIVGLYDETSKSEDDSVKAIANISLDLWDKMFEMRIGSIRYLSNEIMAR